MMAYYMPLINRLSGRCLQQHSITKRLIQTKRDSTADLT